METVRTVYIGDLRTKAMHVKSGEQLLTDAPEDNNGKGEYFSPTDLLATSLGCCILTIMGIAAEKHNFDITGTTLNTSKIMGVNPRRVVELILNFTFPHNKYSEKERKILELSAKECPVANSLHPDVIRSINFIFKN
jgi:uncharacterized OsmC-like protein